MEKPTLEAEITVEKLDEGEEFWMSSGGMEVRFQMLSHEIAFGTFNNAVKLTASGLGYRLRMAGPLDEKTCPYCERYMGHVYALHQFMPYLPAHPWCRHWWDVILE